MHELNWACAQLSMCLAVHMISCACAQLCMCLAVHVLSCACVQLCMCLVVVVTQSWNRMEWNAREHSALFYFPLSILKPNCILPHTPQTSIQVSPHLNQFLQEKQQKIMEHLFDSVPDFSKHPTVAVCAEKSMDHTDIFTAPFLLKNTSYLDKEDQFLAVLLPSFCHH